MKNIWNENVEQDRSANFSFCVITLDWPHFTEKIFEDHPDFQNS